MTLGLHKLLDEKMTTVSAFDSDLVMNEVIHVWSKGIRDVVDT